MSRNVPQLAGDKIYPPTNESYQSSKYRNNICKEWAKRNQLIAPSEYGTMISSPFPIIPSNQNNRQLYKSRSPLGNQLSREKLDDVLYKEFSLANSFMFEASDGGNKHVETDKRGKVAATDKQPKWTHDSRPIAIVPPSRSLEKVHFNSHARVDNMEHGKQDADDFDKEFAYVSKLRGIDAPTAMVPHTKSTNSIAFHSTFSIGRNERGELVHKYLPQNQLESYKKPTKYITSCAKDNIEDARRQCSAGKRHAYHDDLPMSKQRCYDIDRISDPFTGFVTPKPKSFPEISMFRNHENRVTNVGVNNEKIVQIVHPGDKLTDSKSITICIQVKCDCKKPMK